MLIFNNRDFVSRTNAIVGKVNTGLGNIVQEGGDMLVEETRPNVPRLSYTLMMSGTSIKMSNGPVAEAMVQFTAVNPRTGFEYGLIQHENTRYNHPRGGKAHYLLDTTNEVGPQIISLWGSQITALIG